MITVSATDAEQVQFWTNRHRNNDIGFLSNSAPRDVFCYHRLQEPQGLAVADVGVGGGQMSHRLVSLRNDVTCVDITPQARARVSQDAEFVLADGISDCGPFDLALMHLTAQHMTDQQLSCFLGELRLVPQGVLSVQVLHGFNDYALMHEYSRTEEEFAELVGRAGRKIADSFLCAMGARRGRMWRWNVYKVTA